jgi:hypothetical protein
VHGGVHGDVSLGCEGARRGRLELAGIMAMLGGVLAQRKGDGMARDDAASATGPAETFDAGGGDMARAGD